MGKPQFNTKGFTGIVQMKTYNLMPDGRQYVGVAGKVSILADADVVGFEVKGSETANWIARVQGPTGSVNILGCQIRMVHQFDGELPPTPGDHFYQVP